MSYGRCRLCGAVTEFSNTLTNTFVKRDGGKKDTGIKADNTQVPD
jgi:hypothetical protein